jgi:hypothetical protein
MIGFGRRFNLLSEDKPHPIMQWMDDMTNLRLAVSIEHSTLQSLLMVG